VEEVYKLIQTAFDLSEESGSPVLFRLVTSVANSRAVVEIEELCPLPQREPVLEKDIARFTKAGSAICLDQHRAAIARLEKAGHLIRKWGLNRIVRAGPEHGLGILASGGSTAYMEEALEIASALDLHPENITWLTVLAPHPFPEEEVRFLLKHCDTVLVLEELEPILERGVYVEAHRTGFQGKIYGKVEGPLERVGAYDVSHVLRGIGAAIGREIDPAYIKPRVEAEGLAARRPITVCAGCPHRGTYMAIQQAIKKSGLKKNEVVVTGDIGCTILGMNPPFEVLWTEISMGASVGLAQGYVLAGVRTPVIATMGDSTFFHAGIPGLINAVHHGLPLTLIVMDNGWTSMTGMQVNPGTSEGLQPADGRRVDLARIIPALGVDAFHVVDPFDLDEMTAVLQECLKLPGVKVVLARQECAIQAMRRGIRLGAIQVKAEDCNLCQACILLTGCPALGLGEEAVVIDAALCYGCALCVEACHRGALVREAIP
jgi:indolepyruvate ferredoxin oxidoreductase alpha subunit